ncbi:MAG: succinyldiaminopimelate transaminase [Gammaproteobacteria bacterium]|nr:succinyldiaminopimelate transaminase [Gammaproteobacteria bacterium]
MNPDLARLQPYPFEKLARLKAGVTPPAGLSPIGLYIGEPKHDTPGFIAEEIITHLHGLSSYPLTRGGAALRQTIAAWLARRFNLATGGVDPERQVLPVNGTREALFAFAQCIVERGADPLILMPNPFYQIYEGAALLAGAEPWFMNTTADTGFIPDFDAVPPRVWARCQLLYICSPGNPTGAVLDIATLQKLIQLADEHDFVIASDECYSEIYLDENAPPPGLLEACARMGRNDHRRCIVFHSLSKRSNVPGLRSGFVAGDAAIIERFHLYRTYHGCAMPPPTQAASTVAWNDEQHVQHNRALYRRKFDAVLNVLQPVMDVRRPPASFYLWPRTPIDDTEFARGLYARHNVTVLPGSFLSREAHGIDPGHNRVRMALVEPLEECIEAAERIRNFIKEALIY